MSDPRPSSAIRIGSALAILLGVAAVAWLLARREAPPPAASSSKTVISSEIPAAPPAAERVAPEPAAETVEPAPAVMPLTAPDLERFQEASSRATRELEAESPGASLCRRRVPAPRAGESPRRDTTRTAPWHTWLSPHFSADLTSRRAADNLLSVILGDAAGDADFARILDELSPEVRALALQRRARGRESESRNGPHGGRTPRPAMPAASGRGLRADIAQGFAHYPAS